MSLRALLPARSDYDLRPRTFGADLVAGLTVGVVALPLALAFGVSSGVGAAAGLVTAVVAGIVAAVFGGSGVQVSGPTGAMAVVLAPVVAQHGLGSVALVTVLAGVVVLVAGALRLGRLVTFIPWPVVEGFTLGIACVIFLQQVPNAVGVPATAGLNPAVAAWRSVTAAAASADTATLWTLGAAAAVAAVMLVLQRVAPAVPASLVGVALVTVLAEALHAPVARIGALPASLPLPVLPSASAGALRDLLGSALAVAALAAIESLLSARVAATMAAGTGSVYQPDRELVGQGLASVASGLFGGMPATGAIARTAVNVRSGARTRLAAIVHALVILAVIYLATGPVGRIPLAALAGVLMVTTTRMIPARTVLRVVRASRSTAVVFAVTAVITVAFDLIEAVEIGVLVAAFFALRAVAGAAGVHREPLPGPALPGDEHVALFRLEGAMFFGAAERVLSQVSEDSRRDGVSVVVLRLSGLRMVDATGAKALAELVQELERRGVTVLVKGIKPAHLGLLRTVGVLDELRDERHLFASLDDAVEHARSHVARAAAAARPGVR
ncbi:SulP family inorganic anion transporter [Xylanimonas protaetiae]|uniref:SulP family inorganic anion transporter n=1 Tax=Xylanimonas protaetiae TaxID=2509457 RepID=A0A4P6F8Y6_9MICO|nr:SulP family inorganic anion transporter [Xylanimonas protaetiae]QAY71363.1 SulP family inorganic anion transporter [Xylanimonas protaetiae]